VQVRELTEKLNRTNDRVHHSEVVRLKHLIREQAKKLDSIAAVNVADLICPITHELMEDPVVTADGHSYDRASITRWLRNSDKSPTTGLRLPHKSLVANNVLRNIIREHVQKQQNAPIGMQDSDDEYDDMEDRPQSTNDQHTEARTATTSSAPTEQVGSSTLSQLEADEEFARRLHEEMLSEQYFRRGRASAGGVGGSW
jgi:hypothetical protein